MRKPAALLALLLTAAIARPQPGGTAWTPAEIASLSSTITRELHAPVLRGAQIGLRIVDTDRKVQIYSLNADQEFLPASNLKLLIGSAALARLGPSYVFRTEVLADAPPSGGTVDGNVYLRGGGDALLSEHDVDDAAAALAERGIARISGAIVTDASRYDAQRYAPGWQVDDIPYEYAPALSALELEEGVVHVTMTPAHTAGAPVALTVSPQSSAFSIVNDVTTGSVGTNDTSDIVRPWNLPTTIQLVGTYPLGARRSDDLEPSVPDPAAYAGDVFARALQAHGITVAQGVRSGTAPGGASLLWSKTSLPLSQLLGKMWIPSDNLLAELLVKELGSAASGMPGTTAHGLNAERAYLRSIGVDPTTVSIWDGSGLSAYDRITPGDLTAILQADWNGPLRETVLDSLPVAGVRGTLKGAYVGTPAEGAVFAKTGTWTHATTLSGFVQTRTHGPVTFSFLINQWTGDDSDAGPAKLAAVRAAIFSAIAQQ